MPSEGEVSCHPLCRGFPIAHPLLRGRPCPASGLQSAGRGVSTVRAPGEGAPGERSQKVPWGGPRESTSCERLCWVVLEGIESQGPQTDRDSSPFYLCPLPSSPLHPQLRGSRGGEPRKAFPRGWGWGWARPRALVSWSPERSACGGCLALRSALCYSSLPTPTPGRSWAESGVGGTSGPPLVSC